MGPTKALKEYLRGNLTLSIVILIIFSAGIIGGSLGISTLSNQQQSELLNYVDLVLQGSGDWQVDSGGLAQKVIWSNIKLVLLMWFLGMTVVGIPLILLIVFLRGVVLGFTVGFLIQEKALAGVLLTLLSIIPQNIIFVPVLLLSAVGAVSFSLNLIRGKFSRSLHLSQYFIGYSVGYMLALLIVSLGGLVEAYISPAFIRLIAVYF